ncbi:MAG: RNA-binding protein, partial [Chryseobacterium sp.]
MPKLFVGGISPKFTEIQLAELLAIHGEILTVKIIYDRVTKKSKGYGFVEMRDQNGAQQAIDALDGTTIGARELKVSLVEEDNKALQK